MPDHHNSPILVTGASGHFGRSVVAELLTRGAANVTAASRSPAKLAVPGVKTARVDFDDATSMDSAFAGIERLLIVSTDALDPPGQRLVQHRAAIAAAARAGVPHVVYTSMPAPEPGAPIPFAPDHYGSEQALKSAGPGYTILRNNWYFENTLLGMPAALASGTLYTSAGQGGLAQIARDDLAAAAAGALLTETGNATYDLGGPEALTMEEQVAVFNRVLGTAVKVVHLSDEALAQGLAQGLAQAQLPPFLVAFLVAADRSIREGRMNRVTDDVRNLSGRAPGTLEDWLRVNRALFTA